MKIKRAAVFLLALAVIKKSGAVNCSVLTFARKQSFPFHCAISHGGRVCCDPGGSENILLLWKETSKQRKWDASSLCPRESVSADSQSVQRLSCFMRGTCAPDDGGETRSRLRTRGNPATHPDCLTSQRLLSWIPRQSLMCHYKTLHTSVDPSEEERVKVSEPKTWTRP